MWDSKWSVVGLHYAGYGQQFCGALNKAACLGGAVAIAHHIAAHSVPRSIAVGLGNIVPAATLQQEVALALGGNRGAVRTVDLIATAIGVVNSTVVVVDHKIDNLGRRRDAVAAKRGDKLVVRCVNHNLTPINKITETT